MSPQQINKANAQHSTGPKTPAGKKKSSLNALRHGLTGQIVVMPSEDLDAYRLHLQSFADEYDPKGATETHLVQSLADTAWRLNRVAALETNLLTIGIAAAESPFAAPQQIEHALAIAAALESQSKALSNLSIHSQRLSRQFERAVNQLRDLQKSRRIEEQIQLAIMEMHEEEEEMYDPIPDGFDFTEDQIQPHPADNHRGAGPWPANLLETSPAA